MKHSNKTSFKKGLIPWNKNKKGIHLSPKSEWQKGQTPWNKGLPKEQQPKFGKPGGMLGKYQSEKQKEIARKNWLREKNPLWKGGITLCPYPIDWTKTLKRSIRERDHYACQLCGEMQSERAFCVHHIDYNKNNCNPENLITLCGKCHQKTNQNMNYWIKYFVN